MKRAITRRVSVPALVALATLAACSYFPPLEIGEENKNATLVSILELMSFPERHYDQAVRVLGILDVEAEGSGLYLTSEARKFGWTELSIPISFATNVESKDLYLLDGRFVYVDGFFARPTSQYTGPILRDISLVRNLE